mmetsp:Transcript_105248/g.282875  ORF Transcript_105248/g.282875 Transcript_105248/m.282875 type:complete len:211 (-) Transcript_105248:528-1160(-)
MLTGSLRRACSETSTGRGKNAKGTRRKQGTRCQRKLTNARRHGDITACPRTLHPPPSPPRSLGGPLERRGRVRLRREPPPHYPINSVPQSRSCFPTSIVASAPGRFGSPPPSTSMRGGGVTQLGPELPNELCLVGCVAATERSCLVKISRASCIHMSSLCSTATSTLLASPRSFRQPNMNSSELMVPDLSLSRRWNNLPTWSESTPSWLK